MNSVIRPGDDLLLRLWKRSDLSPIADIITVSCREFDQWLPGLMSDLANFDAFIAYVERAASEGTGWYYGIEAAGTIVGQCCINTRDEGAAELGYWVRTDRTEEGFATRAVVAVSEEAARHGFSRLIIRCDEGNARSAAVARKAGFTHVGTESLDPALPRTRSQTGREMTWSRDLATAPTEETAAAAKTSGPRRPGS
jgi:RimJ/RimL family protein N-acetyltransferase